mmetsp:Transcript_16095/g.35488  ORF Transcript_16095/g.35488 Transcript_16095/m.35488 type:complete len:188 (-) Transcript_16095:307-870(-)
MFSVPQGPPLPPSPGVLQMRPYLLLILAIQSVTMILRFFPMRDFWGGMTMILMVGSGIHAVRDSMNMHWISVFGMICFINGFFDSLRAVDHVVNNQSGIVSDKLGWQYNVASVTLLCIPFVTFLGATCSYAMYKDTQAHMAPYLGFDAGAMEAGGAASSAAVDYSTFESPAPSEAAFKPFTGTGHRL